MTITIHDNTGFVPPGDAAALQAEATSWPFDVHLLVENAPNRDRMEDDAHAAVTNPHVMAIAIDPAHHRTEVRFGSDTGVKTGDYDSIARAGNAHLRAGEVQQAIEAIVLRAKASTVSTTALSTSDTPVVVHQGMSGGEILFLGVLTLAVMGFIVWMVRRWQRNQRSYEQALVDNRLETEELRAHNAEARDWEDKVRQTTDRTFRTPRAPSAPRAPLPPSVPMPVNPYMAPVVQPVPMVVNSRDDGFLEGMLIGDALSRNNRTEVIREREVVRETPRSRVSDDGGGAGASWGSGSGSSSDDSDSSPDIGGGSASWDSGGGSSGGDSGGGGGGSDW